MDRQNRIIGLIGKKGSGKSTAFQRILTCERRLVLFDAMAEHDFCPNEFSDLDALVDFLESQYEGGKVSPYFAARYVPPGDPETEIEDFSTEIFRASSLTIGVEEVPQFSSASYLPSGFGRIVRQGRHRSLSLVWTAQRASEVSRSLTAQTDVFVLFSQREPADIEALRARCGEEVAREVSRLGLHDHLTFNVQTGGYKSGLYGSWVLGKDAAAALPIQRA